MKNLVKFATIAAATLPLLAFGQVGGINPVIPKQGTDLKGLIDSIANWATGLLIALSVLFVIYAAFLYLTAAGNEDQVKSAKNIIIYAVIAIVIALLSQLVTGVVKQFFVG